MENLIQRGWWVIWRSLRALRSWLFFLADDSKDLDWSLPWGFDFQERMRMLNDSLTLLTEVVIRANGAFVSYSFDSILFAVVACDAFMDHRSRFRCLLRFLLLSFFFFLKEDCWLLLQITWNLRLDFLNNFRHHLPQFFLNEPFLKRLWELNRNILLLLLPYLWYFSLNHLLLSPINPYFIRMLHKFFIDLTDDHLDALLAGRQKNVVIALVLEGYLVTIIVQITEFIPFWEGLENWGKGLEEFCEFLFVRGLQDVDFRAVNYLEDHG